MEDICCCIGAHIYNGTVSDNSIKFWLKIINFTDLSTADFNKIGVREMQFLKRGSLYLFRHKIRSFILAAIICLATLLLLMGIAMQQASETAFGEIRSAAGEKLVLQIDTDKAGYGQATEQEWGTGSVYQGDYITKDIIDKILTIPGVSEIGSTVSGGFFGAAINFEYLPAQYNSSITEYGAVAPYYLTINSEKADSFRNGYLQLTEGRHLSSEDEKAVMISNELAEYNDLHVGDVITLYCLDADLMGYEAFVNLDIVGIFTGTEGKGENAYSVSGRAGNQGFLSYKTLRSVFGEMEVDYQKIDIFVDDFAEIEDIYDQVSSLPEIRNKTLMVDIDSEEYEAMSVPLNSMQNMVHIFMAIISLLFAVVLTLLQTAWIRERNKEVAILMSLGIAKRNIIAQLITEALMISCISFAVSFFVSPFVEGTAGSFLAQIQNVQAQDMNRPAEEALPGDASQLYDQLTGSYNPSNLHFQVRIMPQHFAFAFMAGLLLIGISTLLASANIIKMKPNILLIKEDERENGKWRKF